MNCTETIAFYISLIQQKKWWIRCVYTDKPHGWFPGTIWLAGGGTVRRFLGLNVTRWIPSMIIVSLWINTIRPYRKPSTSLTLAYTCECYQCILDHMSQFEHNRKCYI